MPPASPSSSTAGPSLRSAFALLPIAAACLPLWATAQTADSIALPGGPVPAASVDPAAPVGPGAPGAGSGGRRGFVFTPVASLQETYSDNVSLQNSNKHSDFATQAIVGFHAGSSGGRLRGTVDYTRSEVVHSSPVSGNQSFNSLGANLTGELITNHLFVDFQGTISQQSLSAFGAQSVDNTSSNSNRTEVSSYTVSPYLRGLLTPTVDYEIRASGTRTTAGSGLVASSNQVNGFAHLGSAQRNLLGWSADVTTSSVRYQGFSQSSDADTAKATLIFNPNPDLALSLIGGTERNNYLTTQMKSSADYGGSIRWQPSVRTRFQWRVEHRYFGTSRNLDLSYRTPHTSWNLIDSLDVTTSRIPTQGLVQAFSADYLLLAQRYASIFPDPVELDAQVRALLAGQQLSPTVTIRDQFLVSQIVLQHVQMLAFSLLGSRESVSFRVNKNTSSGLGTQVITNNGLDATRVLHQTGGSVDLSHRMTPVSQLLLSFQYTRTSGDLSTQLSTLKSTYLTYSTRVARAANVTAGARHVIAGGTAPYVENAIYAAYSQTF